MVSSIFWGRESTSKNLTLLQLKKSFLQKKKGILQIPFYNWHPSIIYFSGDFLCVMEIFIAFFSCTISTATKQYTVYFYLLLNFEKQIDVTLDETDEDSTRDCVSVWMAFITVLITDFLEKSDSWQNNH